jgi:DNA-directed RNA polymerase subunit RPC12/RpoP
MQEIKDLRELDGRKIFNVEGGKSLKCPNCGKSNRIPPRPADELEHIKETKYVVDLHIKRMPEYPFIAHLRACHCPSCNELFYVKDKHTVIHNGKEDD